MSTPTPEEIATLVEALAALEPEDAWIEALATLDAALDTWDEVVSALIEPLNIVQVTGARSRPVPRYQRVYPLLSRARRATASLAAFRRDLEAEVLAGTLRRELAAELARQRGAS